jgi:hypothetical protein
MPPPDLPSAPRATILTASSRGARIQTSHSSSVVGISGTALGWMGSTMAFGSLVGTLSNSRGQSRHTQGTVRCDRC